MSIANADKKLEPHLKSKLLRKYLKDYKLFNPRNMQIAIIAVLGIVAVSIIWLLGLKF